MYKLIIFYECEQVTYIVSPHKEALEFMRDMIEEKYKKTCIKYHFRIVVD